MPGAYPYYDGAKIEGVTPSSAQNQNGYTQTPIQTANGGYIMIQVIGDEQHPASAKVYIDGHEIHGVTKIVFTHKACSLPEMKICLDGTMMTMNALEVEIKEYARVEICRQ